MKITRYGDVGTPELLRRKGIKITLVEGQPRARVNKVSPIHTMFERDFLNAAQFSAGKKIHDCWIRAWCENGSCEVRERVDGASKERELSTGQIHAMKELERGLKAARKDSQLIKSVCIDEIPLTRKGMGGQERARLIYRFRRALNDIARCYGFM